MAAKYANPPGTLKSYLTISPHKCLTFYIFYWKIYYFSLFATGGAQKRGRDFMKIIQKYDPSTETTVILNVSLPISVNCPKAILVRRTAVILGFHQSVAIDMDGLDAVHAVNSSQMEGTGGGGGETGDVLESAAECMTIRKGAKVQ